MPGKELRKKVGQLFVMGFEGRNITAHVKELIARYNVGGLILFSRNISDPVQAWELIRSFREPDLLVCVDHEGGRVVRFPEPVTRFPAARAFGDLGSEELLRTAALYQGRELAALGINWNFAPVLDVWSNPLNKVISDRAFASEPGKAAALGCAYVRGLHAAGVASCGKHFPGHGDTREDSHEVMPRVRTEAGTLEQRELLPFAAAFKAGLPAVMTAHVLYEGIDPVLPATLSPVLVEGFLRRKLGFGGLVVTDDLEMKGIARGWDVEDRTLLALKAGADMLMYCHTPEVQVAAIETVYKALDGRIIRAEQVERSLERIGRLKALARKARPAGDKEELLAVLRMPEHKSLAASLREGK
jgi:beta-N-acetylhexosaminidase